MGNNTLHLLDERVSRLLKSQTTISSLGDALREVVQNSADAKARKIEISIDLRDFSFAVKDDGAGLTPEELDSVGKRYYTSKTKSLEELKKIKTFGFRGEALNSIISVSTVDIVSKTDKYNASFQTLFLNSQRVFGARTVDEDSPHYRCFCGASGTLVSVKNLFSNLPVRLLQLKKIPESKILEEIRLLVLHVSITHPDVEIVCAKKGVFGDALICKVVPTTRTEFLIPHLLNSIYGISLKDHYQYLEASFKDYHIECVVGSLPVQTKSYQHIFYNLRILDHVDLVKEINKEFLNSKFGNQGEILVSSISRTDLSPKKGRSPTKSVSSVGNPYNKYPLFVIKVTGPQSLSDVLQNPSKKVELSKHLNVVRPLILKVIKSFLKTSNCNVLKTSNTLDPSNKRVEDTVAHPDANSKLGKILIDSGIKIGRIRDNELKGMIAANLHDGLGSNYADYSTVEKIVKKRKGISYGTTDAQPHDHRCDLHEEEFVVDKSISRNLLADCQVISQVDKKFILIKARNQTLYIMDQHACDERIRVEAILQEFISEAQSPFQNLSIPLGSKSFEIAVSNAEYDLFVEYTSICATWGIEYIVKSPSIVLITHLPQLLLGKLEQGQEFLRKCLFQYLFDLHNNVKLKSLPTDWFLCRQAIPTIIMDIINSKACRSAIMFGKELNSEELDHLVRKLSLCQLPFYCAHGRPSIVPLCDLSKLK